MNIRETISQHVLIHPGALVVDLKNSHGSWLVDESGKRYLDCFSQFATQPLGWNHPRMITQRDRLADIAIHTIANSDTLSKEYAEFVSEFSRHTTDFKHMFFISGGTLAVENALKAAFDWKLKKLGWKADAMANYLNVVHLRESFHGRSGYALSITNNGDETNPKTWGFPKFRSWTRILNPKIHFDFPEDTSLAEEASLAQLREVLSEPDFTEVAAVIVEPIQGEGGDNHFRKEYFAQLRELADKHNFLLIFDEVQTGVGLTGKFWAYEHFGIVPDLLCFGKKMQACGVLATDRLDEVPDNVFRQQSRINSTWGGNLLDMVRSTMQLEIIRNEKLVENAAEVGWYFLSKLKALKKITNVRGRGLMLAFDLPDANSRNQFMEKLEQHMLALPCGQRSVRVRPPLTFNKSEVDLAIEYIGLALN